MKVLKSISSLMLALLVLLSSMGFFVDHMVCGMSGEHKLAINRSIDSCSDTCDRTEEDAIQKTCCDYDSNYFKEDVPVTSSETSKKKVASSFAYLSFHEVFTHVNCAESSCFHLLEIPDILPSVKRHVLLETYLI